MRVHHVLVFAAALLTLSGCAALRRHEAASTEQLLSAAGFQMRTGDSPERRDDLATTPPLKIVARTQGDRVVYTFADPDKCRCLYVGRSKEDPAHQGLVTERRDAQGP